MSTTDTLSQLVGQSLTGVVDDLARARSLLRDGVAGFTRTFEGFREQLQAQHAELKGVATMLQGQGGSGGFITHMNGIVGRFIDDLVQVSASSMKLVQRVEVMGANIDEVVQNVDRVESLAKETRFIALNARIEAYRSGESGRTFRVVADEVKSLAEDAASFSALIRELVSQTSVRLNETRAVVGQLASHDMNGALEAQQQVLKALESLTATNTRVSSRLAEVEVHIADTVRALQFEDLLAQILDGSRVRLEAVRTLWLTLLAQNTVPIGPSVEQLMVSLEPTLGAACVVKQTSLDAGTVELF